MRTPGLTSFILPWVGIHLGNSATAGSGSTSQGADAMNCSKEQNEDSLGVQYSSAIQSFHLF